jgi:Fe-S cluster assembly protein SufD
VTGFIESAAARDVPAAPTWIQDVRETGRKLWQVQQFPTRKTEAWKYTNLRMLERGGFDAAPDASGEASTDQRQLALLAEIDNLSAHRLVFVNGRFSESLSDLLPLEGARVLRFADATAEEADDIRSRLGAIVDREKHIFAALNDTWLDEGVYIGIDDNADVTTPIHVVWLTTPSSSAFSVSSRLLVVAGKQSRATVIEHFASSVDEQNGFTNGMTEIDIDANAQLNHYRLHLENEHALHIGGVHARLGRDAVFNSFHLGMGGALKRIDAVVHHAGEGAHCEMNGIYLPRHEQQIDYHTSIEHAVPRCTTNETFRGIIGDKAKAVFNGRIHIHPDAQKSDARLSNKNLLTSPNAEVDTKPELEIYADDVQCAHGATVSQLDEEAVFYLVSRGISRTHAEVMLSYGFINELVDQIPLAPIADFIRPKIAHIFGRAPAP